MIQYFDDKDLACFDGLSFRRDKKTGYYLNAKTHKRLHVYVWEYYNGEVPKGFHVHHKDFDKSNNEIGNLTLMEAREHQSLHGKNWTEERRAKQAQMLRDKAVPKATEWHKSEAGREWHLQHYENVKELMHRKKTFVCECCGKEFEAEETGMNRFCSNNCKSKYRRESGVDNEKRICEYCGKEFEVNKYAKTRTCSRSCANKIRWDKRREKNNAGAGLQHGS